jgi:glucokinase
MGLREVATITASVMLGIVPTCGATFPPSAILTEVQRYGCHDDRSPGPVAAVTRTPSPNPIAVLDVGGTSIKGGAVRGEEVAHTRSIPTLADSSADVIFEQLTDATDMALDLSGTGTVGLAIGFPGPFDRAAGAALMHGLHKFDSIYSIELRPELRARTTVGDLPIKFVHDNEAAGVGEAVMGAGSGVDRVLTVTLGTGVGTCLTAHGVPVPALGDLSIKRLALRDTQWGRADDVLSARGLATRLGIDTADLKAAVDSGGVAETVEDHGRRIGTFLSPVVDELSVDMVVIGGGLAAAFDLFGPSLRRALGPTPCLTASLGADGPLLGAALLAFPTPPDNR